MKSESEPVGVVGGFEVGVELDDDPLDFLPLLTDRQLIAAIGGDRLASASPYAGLREGN